MLTKLSIVGKSCRELIPHRDQIIHGHRIDTRTERGIEIQLGGRFVQFVGRLYHDCAQPVRFRESGLIRRVSAAISAALSVRNVFAEVRNSSAVIVARSAEST